MTDHARSRDLVAQRDRSAQTPAVADASAQSQEHGVDRPARDAALEAGAARTERQAETQTGDGSHVHAASEGADRWARERQRDERSLREPWPELRAADAAELKRQFQDVAGRADTARQAVTAAATHLAERQRGERDALEAAHAQQAEQAKAEPPDRQRQVRDAQGNERHQLEDTQQAERAQLAEATRAIEGEYHGAQDRVATARDEATRRGGELAATTSDQLRAHAEVIETTSQRACRLDREDHTQQVRESNLFYDLDHWEPQSKHGEQSNKASNIGFLTADENRRKGAQEFTTLPELHDEPMSLKTALAAGEAAARKLVGDMLGSLRFSEVSELNVLWQRASRDETRSYKDSQGEFRRLLGRDNAEEPAKVREAAETVRQALKLAKVDVVPNKDSFRLRLDDSAYRR